MAIQSVKPLRGTAKIDSCRLSSATLPVYDSIFGFCGTGTLAGGFLIGFAFS
jgi:hypothetical protein